MLDVKGVGTHILADHKASPKNTGSFWVPCYQLNSGSLLC